MKRVSNLVAFFILPVLGFAQNHADCVSAYRICDQERVHFVGQAGEGAVADVEMLDCFMKSEQLGNPEKNSVWIRFDIEDSGTISFAIVPDTLTDDIDFVVFTLPLTGDCNWKRAIRCMAAGDKPENAHFSPCMGATGLRANENDESEDAGCADKGDNNWLKPLKVKAGEKYVLLVSNVSSPYNGFKIRFGGTATFACEEDEKE